MNSNKSEIVVRQRRASKPKVKTGCNNCKKRKVKCDETRPACKRCVKAKVACEGYPAYRRMTEAPLQIAPRPEKGSPMSSTSPTSSTMSPQAIVPARRISPVIQIRNTPRRPHARTTPSPTTYIPGITFNAQEGQYLQVFRTHTAVELSGFFNSEFWSRSVLQESQSEASIRHAVVAIGALYKTLEKSAESPPGSPDINAHETPTAHYNFALEQYGKAIHRLHEALANKDAPERTVLMFAVLLTCFQSFIGDHKAAIWQIQTGLRMLEDRRKESTQPLLTRKQDHIEDELIQMFTRLAIQAKSYDMAFHLPDVVIQLSPKNDPATPQSPGSPSDAASSASIDSSIPEQFTSAQQARCSLDSLTERIMRFNEVLSSLNPGPNNILPRSVQHQGAGFVVALRQWGAAFEELLKGRRNPGVTNTDRAGVLVLGMMHLMTSILFQMGYSTSEMGFDKFVPEFAQIVDLAKEIVVDEELSLASNRCESDPACRHRAEAMRFGQQDAYLHVKSSFALDLGIVPPLFVAATKCRDRRIRREAIRLLLSSHRREGMWDSILSGFVAGWIMGIEEHGMMPFDQFNPASVHQVVPEDKRVMVKEIDFNLQEKIARLRCGTRGKRDGEEDRRARVTMVFDNKKRQRYVTQQDDSELGTLLEEEYES